jgi:ABC-type multidrug transport system fused ATPase/permease subunit
MLIECSLNENVVIMQQEPCSLQRDVFENVRLARKEATDDQVKEACKLAGIHDVIERKPHKYNTVMENDGSCVIPKWEKGEAG